VVRLVNGITAHVPGWTISVDGCILRAEDGDPLYASHDRRDIVDEIGRLSYAIAEYQLRKAQEE
jgi:hypothetical protein